MARNSIFWSNQPLTVIDSGNAPRVFADRADIVTGSTMSRMLLYERLFDHPDADARVVGHLYMPLRGWAWSLANARVNRPPLEGIFDDLESTPAELLQHKH
ncbi:MAG: hypothetical protein VW338_16560 [Rhodospirillaceae bacterium]